MSNLPSGIAFDEFRKTVLENANYLSEKDYRLEKEPEEFHVFFGKQLPAGGVSNTA